jgi:hypothetical protein
MATDYRPLRGKPATIRVGGVFVENQAGGRKVRTSTGVEREVRGRGMIL